MPKIDVFKACELVQLDIELLTPEILSIFIRSLPSFGRSTHFLPTGTMELSWDEKWLISLVSAISRADYDSVHFLIKSGIKPIHQEPCQSIALHLGKLLPKIKTIGIGANWKYNRRNSSHNVFQELFMIIALLLIIICLPFLLPFWFARM